MEGVDFFLKLSLYQFSKKVYSINENQQKPQVQKSPCIIHSQIKQILHNAVERMWYKWINRRSQRKSYNWEEFQELYKRFPLPRPSIVKSYRWIYAANL
jgi:hypothetical protein